MILTIEKSYLLDILDSLKGKLRYISKQSYIEDKVKTAIVYVEKAIAQMELYENHINFVENRQNPTRNCVEKK